VAGGETKGAFRGAGNALSENGAAAHKSDKQFWFWSWKLYTVNWKPKTTGPVRRVGNCNKEPARFHCLPQMVAGLRTIDKGQPSRKKAACGPSSSSLKPKSVTIATTYLINSSLSLSFSFSFRCGDGTTFPCRWFNYTQLPGRWHAHAGNTLVQGCQSRRSLAHGGHLQRRHRAADLHHSARGHRRVHLHCTQWWGTSLPYGPCYNRGRRCNHGKNLNTNHLILR